MTRVLAGEAPLVGRVQELDRIRSRLSERSSAAIVLAGAAGVGKSRLAREAARAAASNGFVTAEVAASASASSISFGSSAPPLPVDAPASSLLERAGPGGRLLLVVDDAHLLDDGSAALVHRLVRTETCGVVATVRSLEPAPDPVTALWKDGLAERLDLDLLSEAEVGQVAAGMLGDPVAGASARRLWELSQGNVLYLRELLAGAIASGALFERGGVWSLQLPLTVPARLVELIAARLAGIAPDTERVIEFVAAGEPLPLSILEQLSAASSIEDAESRGLIELHRDGNRSAIRLAHPLYGETIRQTLPAYRLRRIWATLASRLVRTGARRHEDLLRVAQWQLDAGAPDCDPDLLARAARRAMGMFDLSLAERLARRGVEVGAGFEAELVLGEAKARSGRLVEAESLLAALGTRCNGDEEVARVATARAHNLRTLLGDPDGAAAVLEEALAVVRDEPARDLLLGRAATDLVLDGHPDEALAAAVPLLASRDDGSVARGAYASSVSLALLGRVAESVSVARRGLEACRRSALSTRVPDSQLAGTILAHTAGGEFAQARSLAQTVLMDCLASGDRDGEAAALLLGAYALVETGRLEPACRGFREGASINREVGNVLALRWCLGGLALAEGMRGRAERALAAIAELDGLPRAGETGIYELDVVARGRAWTRTAGGEFSVARATLADAAGLAAAAGQPVAEARLLHDVARLGDPASARSRLEELATSVEGGLVAAYSRHASALAGDSAADVADVALAFESLGASLLAAEAHLTSAHRFRAERLLRRAADASRRARRLLAECGEARTPGLAFGSQVVSLTRREREIAGLVATGASSREIAEKLVLSVRTVDNHLQRVYGKLGVKSRAGLTETLDDGAVERR
jgi:DNA-binding CsgD family transcriptional regulator